jgi:hypothetical protein
MISIVAVQRVLALSTIWNVPAYSSVVRDLERSTCISVVHDLERSSNVFLFHEKQPHAKEKQNRDKAYSFRLQLH